MYYVFCTKNECLSGERVVKGQCMSKHKAYLAASRKEQKLNKPFGYPGSFYLVESDKAFEVGEVYKDDINAHLKTVLDNNLTHLLADIIESEQADEGVKSRLLDRLEDYDTTLGELKNVYEVRARSLLAERETHAQQQAREQAKREALGNDMIQSRSEMTYSFPAVCGIQAGKEYYAAQIPYKYLIRLFVFDDEDIVPPELRAQRVLNETRGRKIATYMNENPTSYVLPALTATVSAEMAFEPAAVDGAPARVGILYIPMDATLLINDGQHRRRGIELALKENLGLAEETVTVTIYFDEGLRRSQQMFADINTTQVKPPSSINTLYNHRDAFSRWVLQILDEMPNMKSLIEFEASSVAKKSCKLWSLSAFMKFITELTDLNSRNFTDRTETVDDTDTFLDAVKNRVMEFIKLLDAIPQWQTIMSGNISAFEARQQFVIPHAVFLEAVGAFGRPLMARPKLSKRMVSGLSQLDVNRSSDLWCGRCVVLGKILKNRDSVLTTASVLLKACDIELPVTVRQVEDRFQRDARLPK